jgi:hypothetical protein
LKRMKRFGDRVSLNLSNNHCFKRFLFQRNLSNWISISTRLGNPNIAKNLEKLQKKGLTPSLLVPQSPHPLLISMTQMLILLLRNPTRFIKSLRNFRNP